MDRLRVLKTHVAGSDIVAVVEDDDDMREAMRRVLAVAGFDPEVYDSAEALLASDGATRAGCLVVDMCLPGMSGLELQKQLAMAGNKRPVIFITAHDDAQQRRQAIGCAEAYLVKPFHSDTLIDAVSRAVAH